jgi:sugar fermentation stimulation protein A
MEYQYPLVEGVLLKRYKRFLADIKLKETGQIITAHTPNTGAMLGCSQPGLRVWVQNTLNTDRKYPYGWELVETVEQVLVGINTLLANKIVREAIGNNKIQELRNYHAINTEVRYGRENSRIDLLLKSASQTDCYIEVKNVTLAENNTAYFPDAVSKRGVKHLRELMDNINNGNRSVIFFCIQRNDVTAFAPASRIHPEYARTLREAAETGVEILAYTCNLTTTRVAIGSSVPILL